MRTGVEGHGEGLVHHAGFSQHQESSQAISKKEWKFGKKALGGQIWISGHTRIFLVVSLRNGE